MPEVLPIYPGHGLFLLVYAGDGERFAKLFRRTWRRIPKPDRDLLLSRWNAEREIVRRRMPKRLWPAIALRRQHHKFDESQEKGRIAFGCAGPGGMSFHEPTFRIMPDRVYSIVIAHELAHRVFAIENPKRKAPRGLGKAYRAHEAKVNERMAQWGFHVESVEQWCVKNRELLDETYWLARLGLA